MSVPEVLREGDAVLLFADIMDSSKFSSVLGVKEYGRRLIQFQKLFKDLGRRYFPEVKDKIIDFCNVDAHGDEGTVFCLARKREDQREIIVRAIEFVYHLKGHLYGFKTSQEQGKDPSPRRMDIGAGIHCGKVAIATDIVGNRKEITQIEGFAINKAKRVESNSRAGKFSKILLSKEAALILEGEPFLLRKISAPLKGITESEDLYEIEAGLLNGLQLSPEKPEEQPLIEFASLSSSNPEMIDEPWLNSLVISIFDILMKRTIVTALQVGYRDKQDKIAWNRSDEDDPILIYLRAKHYEIRRKYTQQIRYLKELIDSHPDFSFAKKRMVEACWKIAKKKEVDRSEKIYARDMAEEYLTKFPHLLTDNDRINFMEIIEELNLKI